MQLASYAQTPAFPTAEGFGKNTTGGRGGNLYIVNNLNDSGPGSLREAVEASGPRIVVFSISGIIELQSQLSVKNDDLTILGQTAPGDGICLANYTFYVNADNLIIRYMRFRPGSYQIGEYDASWGRNNRDIIFDHCSFSWGNDEQASFYDNTNFTMQYCIISESFYASTHPKGNHGYGGIWGGMGASFHHNLIANHTSRLPRFCGARYHLATASAEKVDFRNNVIYNWGFNSAYGGEAGNHNMVNNYFKPGPATATGSIPYRIINPYDKKSDGNPISKWYLDGNHVYGNASVTADNWNGGMQQSDASITQGELKLYAPLATAYVTTESAEDAYNSVLANAGANLVRDAVDLRAINGARTGTANYGGSYGANTGIIDNESQVGGYPTYKTYNQITDTDNDGMADSWERANGLTVGLQDHSGDADGDGYTNIEEYAEYILTGGASSGLLPVSGATEVPVDMQFKLEFSSQPMLQSTGAIKLFKSDGTLISTIDMSQMPSGTPMSATWPWKESLNGNEINVFRTTVDGNTAIVSFPIGTMNYNTCYYITVDKNIFSNAGTIGFNGIAANQWTFTTKSAAPATDLHYVVAGDGSGDFATLQGALDYIPYGNTDKSKILIKNGTYIGLAFAKNRNNLTIEGESAQGVIIKGFNNNNLNGSTHWRSVVNLSGNDINIVSITFINTTPNGGTQAEVLKLNGQRCVIVNCFFYSYQDTVLIEGTVYFKDCMLEGDVDFIWGRGTVYFQSCELRANDNGGYNVMARNNNTKHGYCFADCNLTRTSATTATQYLGRDANTSYPYAEIVYLECSMGTQIPAVGWQIRNEMNGTGIHFAEYKSVDQSGNPINTANRHYLSTQLSDSDALLYRDLEWYFGGWKPVVPNYSDSDPVTTVYEYAGSDDAWTTATNWSVRIPTDADTAIIRTGEVKIYEDINAVVRVEPNGIFRAIGNYTVPNVELQGGTIKVNTSHRDYGFTANVDVQQASTFYAGSALESPFLFQGSLSGSADLAKIEVGILDMDVDATGYTGNWFINAGTFRIANSASISENTVTIADAATLDISADGVYIFNVVLEGAATIKLNDNLSVKKFSIAGTALSPGIYTASDYPNAIFESGTLTVLGNPDCAGIEDGTAFTDYCGACVAGTTGRVACEQIIAEAEEYYCYLDGTIDSNHLGFSGTGFANTGNGPDSTITVKIYAPEATSVIFGVKIANGGTRDRPAKITVNGTVSLANFTMHPTGAWTNYDSTETSLVLEAGINDVSLISTTEDGLANIDYFYLYGNAFFSDCSMVQQEIFLTEGWNLFSINIHPEDSTISALFKGMDIAEIKSQDAFWNVGYPDFLNALQSITTGEGYLVKTNGKGTIFVFGQISNKHLQPDQLEQGWNLIGVPYQSTTQISDVFDNTNCQIIKNFEGFWQPVGGIYSIDNLKPGKAYFIKK